MDRKRVRFTFPDALIREPIIYQLGHEFQVVTNIRMAEVEEYVGWVMLEIDGEPDEIARALDWAEAKGVRVDPVEGDVVEGN
jgi:L-aspartate semialdehyde sulfurtransferase ferredoxin